MGTDHLGHVPSRSLPIGGLWAHELCSLNLHAPILESEHDLRTCLAVLGDIRRMKRGRQLLCISIIVTTIPNMAPTS